MLFIRLLVAILVVLAVAATAATASNVKYVNPLFGTDRPSSAEYGGMVPSTGTPFGMTRWTPYTQENVVGTCPFLYAHDVNRGFLVTHQPAVW
jgi:putative alpha-1,2-mannosidase